MFKVKTKLVAATMGVASTLLLAGCGSVPVAHANGAGSCGGSSFQLTTSKNATGTNIEIDYTGTEQASLFYVQGYASDQGFTSGSTMTTDASGIGADDNVLALKLETDQPGWTSSGTGANTNWHYSGDVLTLLDARTTVFDPIQNGQTTADQMNSLMPAIIGVDCDLADDSGNYGPTGDYPASDLAFEAAAMVFPKEQAISPFEVISATPITNGTHVTFRYTADALSAFDGFIPSVPGNIFMANDNSDIANDTIKHLWDQFQSDSNQPNVGSITDAGDGKFTADITGPGTDLADGNYILLAIVTNPDNTDSRWVFSSLHYEADQGINVEDPFTGETIGHHYDVRTLANTGVDSWFLSQVALGTIAVGAVLMIANRRRSAK